MLSDFFFQDPTSIKQARRNQIQYPIFFRCTIVLSQIKSGGAKVLRTEKTGKHTMGKSGKLIK